MTKKKSAADKKKTVRKNAVMRLTKEFTVRFIPVPVAALLFQERKREVETMITEMILRGGGSRALGKVPSLTITKETKKVR